MTGMFEAAGRNFHGFQKIWCQWKQFSSVAPLEREKKHHTSHSGQKTAKKVQKKIHFKIIIYNFCTAEAARAAHQQTRANACNPMPQCFQIWQVSAKYCTFLDFLAHCCLFCAVCITNSEYVYFRRRSSVITGVPLYGF